MLQFEIPDVSTASGPTSASHERGREGQVRRASGRSAPYILGSRIGQKKALRWISINDPMPTSRHHSGQAVGLPSAHNGIPVSTAEVLDAFVFRVKPTAEISCVDVLFKYATSTSSS